MGAAGRDFHNFNAFYKSSKEHRVVAFTATQIPGIEQRFFPKELGGENYQEPIPIYPEDNLEQLIDELHPDECVFAYSDVSYDHVMHLASRVLAKGVSFSLLGPKFCMLKSKLPVISVCAVRTGCGKSQTSRKVVQTLRKYNKRVGVIRHPMPYGDLVAQKVQKFTSYQDLIDQKCTIEEIEEYEPHIDSGANVYAGVDYQAIIDKAEQENDIILWDGGNNDWSFYKPDVEIVVMDPLRAGDELKFYPGEVNLRRADVIVLNKIDSASTENIFTVRKNIEQFNPEAVIIDAASPIFVKEWQQIRGKSVLVIEDGPTLTHGDMQFGAGWLAAKKFGAKDIIDPRSYAVGSIKDTFQKYSHLEKILPAMGYGDAQISDLKATIESIPCDLVIVGTPIDLSKVINFKKPAVRVRYDLQELGEIDLDYALKSKGLIS